MPFSHRVFCRSFDSPSLSEVLIWLRRQGHDTKIGNVLPHPADLLSNEWEEVTLDGGGPASCLRLRCLRRRRADGSGQNPMDGEVADFAADVSDLAPGPAREYVLQQLASSRSLLVMEFPADGGSPEAEEIAGALAALFVERAQGLAQRDAEGFLDEDGDVVLALA